MTSNRPPTLWRTPWLGVLSCILIGKIVLLTWWSYRDYIPPNFQADFLLGRESYFWQGYQWAFYPHIIAGPIALFMGMFLVSDHCRRRFPRWHRLLGRIQVLNVLLIVVPSGLWMARYSVFGPIAGIGFALLAGVTGATAALGWRRAVQRRFDDHRRWMLRNFALLCSAVIVRVNGGLGVVTGIEDRWFYIQIAWTSWIVPLLLMELLWRVRARRAVTV